MAYLDGAASVIGHAATGCYGFWEDVDGSIASNHASWYWQCGIAPADSDPVHVWQRNVAPTTTTIAGIDCDINDLLRPISGGEPDMDWNTPMPEGDWAKNPQTLASILNHIDQRLFDLHRVVVEPGTVVAHDPTHTKTNLADLIADIAAWELAQGN